MSDSQIIRTLCVIYSADLTNVSHVLIYLLLMYLDLI